MFEVKEAYSKGPLGDDQMVVDVDRDVWLQRVCGLGIDRGDIYKLAWKKRVIPFEILFDSRRDDGGKEYIVQRFKTFGGSLSAERFGLKPYHFEDEEERRQAQFFAIEAVLAYGGFYDGFKHPDGHHQIEFEGRLYTKSDFGLR